MRLEQQAQDRTQAGMGDIVWQVGVICKFMWSEYLCLPPNIHAQKPSNIDILTPPRGWHQQVQGLWKLLKSCWQSPPEWDQYLRRKVAERFQRDHPRLFLSYENTAEGSSCEPGGRLSAEGDHAGILILGFPASKIVSNKFLLFISHTVSGIGTGAQKE